MKYLFLKLQNRTLICKEYIGKRRVIIPYLKGGKRLHIGLQVMSSKKLCDCGLEFLNVICILIFVSFPLSGVIQDFAEDLASHSQAIMNCLHSVRVRQATLPRINICSDF